MPPKKKAPPEEAPAPPVDAPKPTMTPSAQRRASAPYVFKEGQMNEMELMKEMVKMHATLNQIEYWMAIFEVAQEQYSMMHKFMFVLPGIGIGAFMSSGAFSSLFRGCDAQKNQMIFIAGMGMFATALTSMQATFKFDAVALSYEKGLEKLEDLREKIIDTLRDEDPDKKDWDVMFETIEETISDTQRSMLQYPTSQQVANWARRGGPVYLKLKQRRDDEFDLDEDEMIEGFVTTADLCLPWIVPYRKKMDLTEDCGAPYGDIKEVKLTNKHIERCVRALREAGEPDPSGVGGDRFPEVFVYKVERVLQERKSYMEERGDEIEDSEAGDERAERTSSSGPMGSASNILKEGYTALSGDNVDGEAAEGEKQMTPEEAKAKAEEAKAKAEEAKAKAEEAYGKLTNNALVRGVMSGVTQGKGKIGDLMGKGSANKASKKAAAKKAAWAKADKVLNENADDVMMFFFEGATTLTNEDVLALQEAENENDLNKFVTGLQLTYELCANYYKTFCYMYFVFPLLFLNTCSVLFSFYATNAPCGSNVKWAVEWVSFLSMWSVAISTLQGMLQFDARAEKYRVSSIDYTILKTKCMGMLRREELDEKLWAELKDECERVKPDQPPPKTLLKKWKRQGKLEVPLYPPGIFSLALIPHKDQLVADGISGEYDFKFVTEDTLREWKIENKYPLDVIDEMESIRQKALEQDYEARQEARKLKKALAHVGFRTTTVKALYRQGVNKVKDLQFLDDAALDDLLDDLLSRDKPPRLVPWEVLEDMTLEVRTFGCLCTPARMCQKLIGKKPRPQTLARLELLQRYRIDHKTVDDVTDTTRVEDDDSDSEDEFGNKKPPKVKAKRGALDGIKAGLNPMSWIRSMFGSVKGSAPSPEGGLKLAETQGLMDAEEGGTAFGKGADFAKNNPQAVAAAADYAKNNPEAVGAAVDMAKDNPDLLDQKYAEMAADADAGAAAAASVGAAAEARPSGGAGGGGLPPMPTPGDSVLRQNASAPRAREQSDGNVSTGSHSSRTDLDDLPEMSVAPPGQSVSVEGRGAYDDLRKAR